jgi:Ca2+-binding RTX toxin-like protein
MLDLGLVSGIVVPATRLGGPGKDVLKGMNRPGYLGSGGGKDGMFGDTGPDRMYGGNGADEISDGGGRDIFPSMRPPRWLRRGIRGQRR